mmetsp:Transcript_47138/g.135812  ORF Transcript_47138/g.135812 Transcript_47138/m.135812 type:complete len:287 (-) Transcript_47138:302-1162(-)
MKSWIRSCFFHETFTACIFPFVRLDRCIVFASVVDITNLICVAKGVVGLKNAPNVRVALVSGTIDEIDALKSSVEAFEARGLITQIQCACVPVITLELILAATGCIARVDGASVRVIAVAINRLINAFSGVRVTAIDGAVDTIITDDSLISAGTRLGITAVNRARVSVIAFGLVNTPLIRIASIKDRALVVGIFIAVDWFRVSQAAALARRVVVDRATVPIVTDGVTMQIAGTQEVVIVFEELLGGTDVHGKGLELVALAVKMAYLHPLRRLEGACSHRKSILSNE